MRSISAMLVVAGTFFSSIEPCHAQENSRKLRWNANEQPNNQSNQNSVIRMNSWVNGENYELEMNGDDIRATVNGEPVPNERIRRSDSGVEILDENGGVLHRFGVVNQKNGPRPSNDRRRVVVEQDPQRPKVMIGITMNESQDGVRVEDVIDGLPASVAGLKVGDVIVEVNGQPIEDPAQLREMLNTMEVGDVARILVTREDKRVELKVKLDRFDEDRLGRESRGRMMNFKSESPVQRAHKEFINELRESTKDLGLNDDQIRMLEDRLGSTFDRLTESMNLGLMGARDGMTPSGPNHRVWTFDDSMPEGMTFMIPRGGQMDDSRFDELMRRFEAMEKRIESLSRRLEGAKQADPE